MSNEIPVGGATTANPGASKAAISFHYDLGNEFFKLFLDRECCYSCAMYEKESDSFEAAQQRKLEYHIQQARADGAARVLDIGCGPGFLCEEMAEIVGRDGGVVGIDTSRELIALCDRRNQRHQRGVRVSSRGSWCCRALSGAGRRRPTCAGRRGGRWQLRARRTSRLPSVTRVE